jgi:hypothetical protein
MADYIRYANQGATRNLPLDSRLVEAFRFLPELGVSMEVFSGGQPAKGSGLPRVGSTRHDHGNAADVFFVRGDQRLDWNNPQDQAIFKDIVARAKAAGVTGFGAGSGYMQPGSMHVGFGNPGVWGAGGKGANAPSWLREAYGLAPAPEQTMIASAAPAPSGRSMPSFAEAMGSRSAAPTMANMQNKSFDPIGEVMAAAGQGAMPQQMAQAFGDVVAPQAPMSFGNVLDSFNRRRRQADEEEQARQSRLAALFASMPA